MGINDKEIGYFGFRRFTLSWIKIRVIINSNNIHIFVIYLCENVSHAQLYFLPVLAKQVQQVQAQDSAELVCSSLLSG